MKWKKALTELPGIDEEVIIRYKKGVFIATYLKEKVFQLKRSSTKLHSEEVDLWAKLEKP